MTQAPSYPPEKHVLRDLRFEVEHDGDGTSRVWLPVTPQIETPSGGVRAGALVTLVDALAGGLAAITVAPDWIATADLTLHLVPDRSAGAVEEVEGCGRVARAGRTTAVLEVELSDRPALRHSGLATMTFSVLPRREDNPTVDIHALTTPSRSTMAIPGSGLEAPFDDALGLRLVEAAGGVLEADVTDYIGNSLGAVQGGVVGTMVESAAVHALTAACRAPVEAVDLQITYLALGRTGPIRTRSFVLAAHESSGAARVEVRDAGAGDRLMTWATVVCSR